MTRLVFFNQDLRGQLLDAAAQPDGHARESLVQGCMFDVSTRFVGDWCGSDYLNNTGPADWSLAKTYGSYWRGNTLSGSVWPQNIGFLHHEPVADIFAQRLPSLAPSLQGLVSGLPAWVSANPTFASWDTTWDMLVKNLPGATRTRLIAAMHSMVQGFPKLEWRVERLEDALLSNKPLWTPPANPLVQTVRWPSGATLTVDATALPPLPDASRYSLSRWAEAQAELQRPGGLHFAFCFSIVSMIVSPMASADAWLLGLEGY